MPTDDYAGSNATTGQIFFGSSVTGSIETTYDQDWFAFTLNAGNTYIFTVEGLPSSQGALSGPTLRVINSLNGIVGLSSGNSATGNSATVTYDAPNLPGLPQFASGTYFISVQAYYGWLSTGTYRLSMAPSASTLIFTGTSGNDALLGGAGNDILDGGAGIDTAGYTATRANFTVTASGAGFTVADNTGTNGTDTLVNIERLSFTDGCLGLDISGTSGQMYRLYKAAFNRIPDAPGLGWNIDLVDGGLTLAQMSAAFVASAEFTSTYGSLTNTQFLDQLYLNVLGRPADPVGAAWNLNLLDTNAVDRPGMLAAYSESAENQAAVIGQIQDGIWFI